MWQAEADTELTLSASHTTAVGQKALFHGIPNQRKFNEDFGELFKFEMATKATEIIHFNLVHFFVNQFGNMHSAYLSRK